MKRYFFLILLIPLLVQACVTSESVNIPTSTTIFPKPSATTQEMMFTSTPHPSKSATPLYLPSKPPYPIPTMMTTNSKPISQVMEPNSTKEFIGTEVDGKIYVWVMPVYGSLNPSKRFQEDITPLGDQYDSETTPSNAIIIAFSYYTQQIAYLLENPEQKLTLWLSDLEIQDPHVVWVDQENVSGYTSKDDLLSMHWGLGDQFIFFRNRPTSGANEDNYYWLVYVTKSKNIVSLSGPCTGIFVSPQSDKFAIACPINETNFVVLEQDGTYWNTNATPEDIIFAKDWVFSPDGNRVLYANENDEIVILSQSIQKLTLPIYYAGASEHRILQWSQDGSKLLIKGNDVTHCPFYTLARRTPPCWQVFDANSGEIVWTSSLVSGYDASLSPNGKWVVMFHADYESTPIRRWGVIYSVNDNAAFIFYNWVADAVNWGN